MKCVEVVRGPATSDATVETSVELTERLGKTPVVLNREIPGFVANRILGAVRDEAIHLLENGIASVGDIDTACRTALGYPMGPFELMDLTGIDIGYLTKKDRFAETGDPKDQPSRSVDGPGRTRRTRPQDREGLVRLRRGRQQDAPTHRQRSEVMNMSSKLNLAAEFTKDLTTARDTDYYLLSDLLTDEEREIRDRVRAFVDTEVLPIINDYWERAEFPFELVPKLAQLGVVGGPIRATAAPACPASPRAWSPWRCPAATAASTPSWACRTAWRWARSTCSARTSRSSAGCPAWPSWRRSARSR